MSMSFSSLPSRLLLRSRLFCIAKFQLRLPWQARPFTPPPRIGNSSLTLSSHISRNRPAFRRTFSFTPNPRTVTTPTAGESPLGGLADSFTRPAADKALGLLWPDISDKKAGIWLLGSATLVFGIVVLGGLTRLTESGFVLSFPYSVILI
jgi:cytochrome c oxidase assembly protein subunit 15